MLRALGAAIVVVVWSFLLTVAADEMGGNLSVTTDGPGRGSRFTLQGARCLSGWGTHGGMKKNHE